MITIQDLRERYTYDPVKGEVWSTARGTARKLLTNGKVRGKSIKVHIIAWALQHGEFPSDEIDHADRNTNNNRNSNIREATHRQNCQNRVRENATGFKGVSRNNGKWKAQISDNNGRQLYLGSFPTKEEAHAAYVEAARKYHGEFANTGSHK